MSDPIDDFLDFDIKQAPKEEDDEFWDFGIEANEESEINDIENISSIPIPFNPKDIKITVETITIYGIVQKLKIDGIDLYPTFQRKANLWDIVRQSRLIESLLLRFPLPAFYFDVANEDKWLVVDGLQRLSALKHFLLGIEDDGFLALTGLEIMKDLEGKTFKTLDATLRQRILNTNITTFQIQAGTPKQVKYNLFKRINTGGLGLTPMEIRHALNQEGNANYFFELLNNDIYEDIITANKIPTLRFEDRELALRFVAFTLTPYTKYQPPMGDFLDRGIELLDKLNKDDCDDLGRKLWRSIKYYRYIFENTRFGQGLTRRAKFNSAIFEVWTSELAKFTRKDFIKIIKYRQDIIADYQLLLQDNDFRKSVSSSTASKKAVETRFKKISELLQKYENVK
jgi:hypothetical protein